jgi:hypothetical protein
MTTYDDSKWNDSITDEKWVDAIERGRAYRCNVCGRRNVGTWICNGIPCLDYNCTGRYGPVVPEVEQVAS